MIRILPALLAGALLLPLFSMAAPASFADREEVRAFAADVAQRHGFDKKALLTELAAAPYQARAIRLIRPPSEPGVRSWKRYRARFIEPIRIRAGLDFWRAHGEALSRASMLYGVPEEVILGIIGVESIYGRYTGKFSLIGALATLAFDYPPRAPLFRKELEHLFLLARANGRSPASYFGSYAGAIGYPQFLPSSVLSYAVDFDGNGAIDLENSPADAIGSVARYLAEHGWREGQPIADPVVIPAGVDAAALVSAGIEPALDAGTLGAQGIALRSGVGAATLVDLESPNEATEYWLGYRNFYVITRYNRSSFYAMAVFHLSEALRDARAGR